MSARLFWTVVCGASSRLEEAVEHAVLAQQNFTRFQSLEETRVKSNSGLCGGVSDAPLNLETTCSASNHAFLSVFSLCLMCVFNYPSAD